MKVKIGPYLTWWGPYQIADLLQKVGVSEETCYKIGKKLSDTWVKTLCSWIYEKRKRKIKVKIDNYDTWNLDHTLSLIIHPALIKFKEIRCGIPHIDKEDIPESLHSSYNEEEGYSEEAWNYVLNEMIWAFDPEWDEKYGIGSENYTFDYYDQCCKRREKATTLFGKYYNALWS